MPSQIRGRISYSSVTATLALVLALGGSSFAAPARDAASKLFSGKQIKNNSIASADIKNNSVGSGDVKNGSLLSRDFKRGQLPAGPGGPAGAAGPRGTAGSGQLSYRTTQRTLANNDDDNISARCPDGKYATGGGAAAFGPAVIEEERPDGDGGGWTARAQNTGGDDAGIEVYAICAPGPVPEGLLP